MTLSHYKEIHNFFVPNIKRPTYQWREGGGEGDLRKINLANRPKNSFIEQDEKIES